MHKLWVGMVYIYMLYIFKDLDTHWRNETKEKYIWNSNFPRGKCSESIIELEKLIKSLYRWLSSLLQITCSSPSASTDMTPSPILSSSREVVRIYFSLFSTPNELFLSSSDLNTPIYKIVPFYSHRETRSSADCFRMGVRNHSSLSSINVPSSISA